MAEREVWVVSVVSYKGERYMQGYAFFSEPSARHHIELEQKEDTERLAHGRPAIHQPDTWEVVRYIPADSAPPAQQEGDWVSVLAMQLREAADEAARSADHDYHSGKAYAFEAALAMLNKLAPAPPQRKGE